MEPRINKKVLLFLLHAPWFFDIFLDNIEQMFIITFYFRLLCLSSTLSHNILFLFALSVYFNFYVLC